ncbi:site-specific tyrosine recombinase XerC [Limihaloglobus sulfuriphilus]|uniref:Site-specific tyrosine recombinase XerC n=1 Tax=Limihaloglobus sulfuriphilus TaxID=1851148 RepID=A0A1Q2MCY0_9BACT|nr:site-specific tyrosine recombinase XerC [Limihaloglobus sulfuriphilus]
MNKCTLRDGDADFHALRHSYCTLLAKSGADLIVSQKLMRHSKTELTANYYTHLYVDDLRTAADRLPDITSYKQSQKKTGTNDTGNYDHNYDYTERQTCTNKNKSGLLTDVKAEAGNPLKGTKNADFEPKTAILQTGGDGIRTHEYRFCKPIPEKIKCFNNNDLQILKIATVTRIDTSKTSTLILSTSQHPYSHHHCHQANS